MEKSEKLNHETASSAINLCELGIDKAQAAVLRECFATFAEDWESPEMDVYDNYEEEISRLRANTGNSSE